MFDSINYLEFIESPIKLLSDQQVDEHIDKCFMILNSTNEKLLWQSSKIYKEHINKIYGLKDLIKEPFLLMVTILIMPRVIDKYNLEYSNNTFFLNKTILLDDFIEQLFEFEEDKLMVENKLPRDGSDIKEDFWAFAIELAVSMYESGDNNLYHTYDDYFDVKDKFFGTSQDIELAARLSIARNSCGCILKIIDGNKCSFIHPILQDYFLVKKILLDEEKLQNTVQYSQNKLKIF